MGVTVFSTHNAGTTGYPHAKNEAGPPPPPTTYIEINSNVRAKTIKLLEENAGVNLCDPLG